MGVLYKMFQNKKRNSRGFGTTVDDRIFIFLHDLFPTLWDRKCVIVYCGTSDIWTAFHASAGSDLSVSGVCCRGPKGNDPVELLSPLTGPTGNETASQEVWREKVRDLYKPLNWVSNDRSGGACSHNPTNHNTKGVWTAPYCSTLNLTILLTSLLHPAPPLIVWSDPGQKLWAEFHAPLRTESQTCLLSFIAIPIRTWTFHCIV